MAEVPTAANQLPRQLYWGIDGAARNDCDTECDDFTSAHEAALAVWQEGLQIEKTQGRLSDQDAETVYSALHTASEARRATWNECGGRMDVPINSTRPCPISGKLCEIRDTLGKLSNGKSTWPE